MNFTVLQVLADMIFLPETYAPIILTRKVGVFNPKTNQTLGVTLIHNSGPETETEDQTMGIAQPTYVLSIDFDVRFDLDYLQTRPTTLR